MPYSPILATLGYILSPDGKQVLLVHRNKRPDDPQYGKYNGLGGKLHADEDVVACMRREIKEEANLECLNMVLRGTISWPGFGKAGEDWFGFIFRVDTWSGTPRENNSEGDLLWVDVAQMMSLSLWEGDRHFLPLVFGQDYRQFHGVMPYKDGRPLSWTCSWLGDESAQSKANSGPSRPPENAAAALRRAARRCLARGETAKAIDLLDIHRPAEWTVVDAAGAGILRLLGQAFTRQGDWQSGRECLEQLRGVQRAQRLLPARHYSAALTDLLRCCDELGLTDLAANIRDELQGVSPSIMS